MNLGFWNDLLSIPKLIFGGGSQNPSLFGPTLNTMSSTIVSATSGEQPLCIDDAGSSGKVDLVNCTTIGSANQVFTFSFAPLLKVPGFYNMGAIKFSNGCLDAAANGGGNNSAVRQSACLSTKTQNGFNQQWAYHVQTSTIRPFYNASLCLDIAPGGNSLIVDTCHGYTQEWVFPGAFASTVAVSLPLPPPPPPMHSMSSPIISATSGAQPLCIDQQTGSGTIDVANCTSGAVNQLFNFALAPLPSTATVGFFSMGCIKFSSNGGNTLCLDATTNGGGNGTTVVQSACLGTDTLAGSNQQWLYHLKSSTIRPLYNAGLCLDIASNGNSLLVAACGSFTQVWMFPGSFDSTSAVSLPGPPPPPPPPPLHSMSTFIISGNSGVQPLCIDQAGSSTSIGSATDVAVCTTSINQLFNFTLTPYPAAPGVFSMGSIQFANGNNLCLDATSNGGGSGTAVVQSTCLSSNRTQAGSNQQWYYHLKTSTIRPIYNPSLCLDASAGGKLVVDACGSFSQTWLLL